jgi:membrane carboxypeptidase/penicillin-binding protein
MEKALKDVPEAENLVPEGMVALPINDAGLRDESSTRIEYFYQENVPSNAPPPAATEENALEIVKDQLL